MGSTLVAVAAGDDGATVSVFYTADGGDTWAVSATGPTAEVEGVVMCSATIGYLLSGNTWWKTTNGGANWTDTTHAYTPPSAGINHVMYPISTTKILVMGKFDQGSSIELAEYDNTATTTTVKWRTVQLKAQFSSNIIAATNGNYYFLIGRWASDANDETASMTLYKYDGTYCYAKSFEMAGCNYTDLIWRVSSTNYEDRPALIEVTNVLYVNITGTLLSVNVAES